MKKNKKLDKIVTQALAASVKGDKIDTGKVNSLTQSFKKLGLEEAIYALNAYKKGLQKFEAQRTLTVYAPVEIPASTLSKIQASLHTTYQILNTKFELTPSLLAGFKFKIGDNIFDSSLRGSLENLKNQ